MKHCRLFNLKSITTSSDLFFRRHLVSYSGSSDLFVCLRSFDGWKSMRKQLAKLSLSGSNGLESPSLWCYSATG